MAIDLTVVIDEKKAVNQFRRLRKEAADAVSGISKEFDKMDSTVDDFAENIELSKKYIEELKRKYQEVSAALSKAPLGSKERAVLGMELRNINNELKAEEQAIRDAETALKSQERTYASLESEMKAVKNEMAQLEMAGQRNSTRYKELEDRLGQLATAHKKVQLEQKKLSTGATQWAGIQSGLQGVLGAFAAGQGIIGAFTSDTEKLVKIQTRLQSIMGIIMGMTQVSNTLHETSAFRTTTLTKVTELWNAANHKVAAGLVKVGVSANVASVAAKTFTASMTLGLSVAISAAIAGINKLITKYQDTKKAAEEAAQAQRQSFRDYTASVASNTSGTLVKFNQLKQKYEELGDSLDAKKKFIKDNAEAFKELGVNVESINDAENLFITNAAAFAKSVELKARATAAMELAAKKYEAAILNMLNAENLDIESREDKTWLGGRKTTYSAKGLTDEQNKVLDDIINSTINKHWTEHGNKEEAVEAGIEAGKEYIKGIKTGLEDEAETLQDEAAKIINAAARQRDSANATLKEGGITAYHDKATGKKDETNTKEEERRLKALSELILTNKRALVQSQIDITKDGREKELKEIELWLEDQISAIEKARQQMLELKGLLPTDSLDDETEAIFNERKANAEIEAENRRKEANARYEQQEAELYASLLDKYASYEDKKQQLLIAYLEESDVLQAEYENTGDERFKRSLEERHKAYQQALASLEQEFNTTDYQLIFGDHAKQSMETLAKAAELIKKKIKELGDNANPETVRALYDELNEIENLQISNPFEGWDASMMGVIKQLYQIRKLEDEITKLNNQGQKKEADAVKSKLEKSQSDLAKSIAATGASEFANALSSAADSMKQIAEITGDVQLGETAEVLSGIAQNFSAAAQGAASGGWIGAIVGGVTDAIGQISNYLVELKIEEERSKAALRSFAEEMELMKFKLNEDDFSGIFGEKTLAKAKEAYKLYTEAWDAYYNGDYNAYQYTKYKGFLSWGHSWNPIDVNSLGQTTVQMKKNGKELKSLAEIYPEIFNEDGSLNLAAAEAALANYAGIADGEFDTAYKALEGAVELQKQINENAEILNGIIGEYTQDMATNLSESIFDSILTGADAWDTFKQKGSQTILSLGKQMLTELIMSQILEDDTKQYQKRLREALGRGDTEAFSEIYVEMMNDLHKNMEMGIEAAQNWIDDMKEQGFDMSAISGQTASAKGFQAMSQDTGDELNGRFTDIQGKVTDIRDYVLLVLQRNDATLNETLNIRDIMIQMNGNVADIRTYTSVLPEMRDTMERMNRKLDEI